MIPSNPDTFSIDASDQPAHKNEAYPPAFLEYCWYVNLVYMFLGQVWGIIIPLVGGAIWALVAVGCFLSVYRRAKLVYRPVAWAFYAGILVIIIQVLFHRASQEAWRAGIDVLAWMAMLLSAQALSHRPQFLQRFAVVMLVIGAACVPFIQVRSSGNVMRAWASGTGIGNPNGMGLWFGFCTVYSVFWGFHSQKQTHRAVFWTIAAGCFFMVLLSVSRAPLVAILLACVVGLGSVLKRGYIPLLLFTLFMYVVYLFGLFDEWLGYYAARGTEETGRSGLWATGVERFLNAPWVGYGLDDVKVMRRANFFANPHNGPLHLALAAGIFPVVCFMMYVVKAIIGALRVMRSGFVGEAAIIPPLVAFGVIEVMILDYAFMSPWVVVVFGLATRADQRGTIA